MTSAGLCSGCIQLTGNGVICFDWSRNDLGLKEHFLPPLQEHALILNSSVTPHMSALEKQRPKLEKEPHIHDLTGLFLRSRRHSNTEACMTQTSPAERCSSPSRCSQKGLWFYFTVTAVGIRPEVAARLWLIDRMRSPNHVTS